MQDVSGGIFPTPEGQFFADQKIPSGILWSAKNCLNNTSDPMKKVIFCTDGVSGVTNFKHEFWLCCVPGLISMSIQFFFF